MAEPAGAAAIAGSWETASPTIPHVALADLHVEAATKALQACQLEPHDIDGIACSTASPIAVAAQLGIRPRWIEGTVVHGCSTVMQLRRASAAIATGAAAAVIVVHAETLRSQVGVQWRWPPTDPASLIGQFETPFGGGPQGMVALYLARYLRTHGLTDRDLAAVPVAQRRWANANPGAAYGDLITEDDVLASPVIAWPLHRLECAATTDNAGAFVVTSAARAAELVARPVRILGVGEGYDSELISQTSRPLAPRALREAIDGALTAARVRAAELDHLMLYDGFAHCVLYALDALGVCEPGGGPELVRREGSPGGRWPINTNGGYLSYRHGDMAQIHESIRQLRGEACRQLPEVRASLVLGVGPVFSAAAAVVLSTEPS